MIVVNPLMTTDTWADLSGDAASCSLNYVTGTAEEHSLCCLSSEKDDMKKKKLVVRCFT